MREKLKLKEQSKSAPGTSQETALYLTKLQAEEILNEAYQQTEGIYCDIQYQLTELKKAIKEYKVALKQEKEKKNRNLKEYIAVLELTYVLKQQALKKTFAESKKNLIDEAAKEEETIKEAVQKKSAALEKEVAAKRRAYQKLAEKEFEQLEKEKERFLLYQAQMKEQLENKEKNLFYAIQKKQDEYLLREQELQNQMYYYRGQDNKRKIKNFRTSLVIFLLASLAIIWLSFLHPISFLPIFLFILIACLAAYLICTNLLEGKTGKEANELLFYNSSLVENNAALKEEIAGLEEDLKKVLSEKAQVEKTDRSITDHFQFLKIMQQDLKESEMNRKVLESENAALRKYLISQDSINEDGSLKESRNR